MVAWPWAALGDIDEIQLEKTWRLRRREWLGLSSVSIYYSMKLPSVHHDRGCDRIQVRKHLSKASRGIQYCFVWKVIQEGGPIVLGLHWATVVLLDLVFAGQALVAKGYCVDRVEYRRIAKSFESRLHWHDVV